MLHRENKAILPLTFLNGQDVRSPSIVGFASALIINDPPMPPPLNGGVEMVVMLLIATRVIHKAYSGEEFAKMTKVPLLVLQK